MSWLAAATAGIVVVGGAYCLYSSQQQQKQQPKQRKQPRPAAAAAAEARAAGAGAVSGCTTPEAAETDYASRKAAAAVAECGLSRAQMELLSAVDAASDWEDAQFSKGLDAQFAAAADHVASFIQRASNDHKAGPDATPLRC